jgi:metal-responsive CopG/Arc/MetJ family transcriptional regulator
MRSISSKIRSMDKMVNLPLKIPEKLVDALDEWVRQESSSGKTRAQLIREILADAVASHAQEKK